MTLRAFLLVIVGTSSAPSMTSCADGLGAMLVPARDGSADGLYRHARASDGVPSRAKIALTDDSLDAALALQVPSEDVLYWSPQRTEAMTFRFVARRGHRLVVDVEALQPSEAESSPLVMDLFRDRDSRDDSARDRAWLAAGTSAETLELFVEHEGAYVLRLQPTLLIGGTHVLRVRLDPSLAFPVEGIDPRAVASTFGAPRDRGRRVHHGIDIFADRGTKALAICDAKVLRVGTNRLGGNVVWLRSEDRPLVFYYAHLERALVRAGQRVSMGTAIGEVGNSGNARTTAPHLHFGIYGRGPIDPFPFVAQTRKKPPPLRVSIERLGRWSRIARNGIRLRDAPHVRSKSSRKLAQNEPVLLVGARGAWLRVELVDGTSGWLPASSVQAWPKRQFKPRLADTTALLERPTADAAILGWLDPTTPLSVRSRSGGYRLVETKSGEQGWIAPPSTPPVHGS